MKTKIIIAIVVMVCCYGCNLKHKNTSIQVVNPERHYYPMLRGEVLDVVYEVENTGENPLYIDNIDTSGECVVVDESSSREVPVGGKGFIKLQYNSNKNIGYVKHYVTIYANLEQGEKHELSFDLHIVPNALYTKNYEKLYDELYREYQEDNGPESPVESEVNYPGYYVENIQ